MCPSKQRLVGDPRNWWQRRLIYGKADDSGSVTPTTGSRSWTGWLAPWCPCPLSASWHRSQRQATDGQGQMPNTGMSGFQALHGIGLNRIKSQWAPGSPGPFARNNAIGLHGQHLRRRARAFAQGTTVQAQPPRATRRCAKMLFTSRRNS